jgi:hypothetical protein
MKQPFTKEMLDKATLKTENPYKISLSWHDGGVTIVVGVAEGEHLTIVHSQFHRIPYNMRETKEPDFSWRL